MRTSICIFFSFCLLSSMLSGCAGGALEEEDTEQTTQQTREAPCGGACGEGSYNACTCGAEDPCGWSGDDVCDRRCRDLVDEVEIFDDKDCPGCAVTMCLTGAINHSSGSNSRFRNLCEDPRIPGRIPDCRSGKCYSTWGSFTQSPKRDLLPGLVDALDTNGDGYVNDRDQACQVNLVGFSWGGVNAVELARAFALSDKVSGSRATVDRLIVMDAFQPFRSETLKVPVNVSMARNYRHSVAPTENCSRWAPLGPYRGFPLRCPSWQSCREYDYSMDPGGLYRSPYGQYRGRNVDHCTVPAVSHEAVIGDLTSKASKHARPPKVTVFAE